MYVDFLYDDILGLRGMNVFLFFFVYLYNREIWLRCV